MVRAAQKVMVGFMVATLGGLVLAPWSSARRGWEAAAPRAGLMLQGALGGR